MHVLIPTVVGLALIAGPNIARAQNVEAILQNGPDSAKKIVAVIGDGYTNAELPTYRSDVDALVLRVFEDDVVFRRNHTAFNVYRIDAVSAQSGVSQIVYDENGTSSNPNDDTIVSQTTVDTALGYIYSGSWAHCWMQGGPQTQQRIQDLLSATVPNADYVVIILNESGFGGCAGSGRLVVTRGAGWAVSAHEFGHGFGGLKDEYSANGKGAYSGSYNSKNCTTKTVKSQVVWSDLIASTTSVPTTYNSGSMDPNTTVGAFEGCLTYETGIYRPVHSCRMKSNGSAFCPVCSRILDATLAPYLDNASDWTRGANWPGAACRPVNGATATVLSDGTLRNDGANAVDVSCPERRVSPNGFTNRAFATVFAIDRHPTQNVCCHMETKNPGGATRVGEEVCTSDVSIYYQVLKLDFPKVYDPYTWSHFHVDCRIPANAGTQQSSVIQTYRVMQQRF